MNTSTKTQENEAKPQCRYFVPRKKRLCRMTVRPGKNYCGEHEPEPQENGDGELDNRVPCPLDPKHTCYASKLEKHLQICNAKQGAVPEYIVHNINAPMETASTPRRPLSQIPKEDLLQLIQKVNHLYEKHIEGNIETLPPRDIHPVVLPEFSEPDRTEASRRHLRQASRLLRLLEDEGLVQDHTCYVELGAGKGHMSYYACRAWCLEGADSVTLLVDRAALRHKRDNKLKERSVVVRLRADLAHVSLARVPAAAARRAVGLAKHLCGVATDYALRCLTSPESLAAVRGAALATCCHHRCDRAAFIAPQQMQELGISDEEFNILLGIVSWATCGDGRSRETRNNSPNATENNAEIHTVSDSTAGDTSVKCEGKYLSLSQECREAVGRRAKALIDWARVLYLRSRGFEARLCYYVPTSVSLENVCIIAKKNS
ncbi:unnamed protein product [Plutella xylostella]|uniref:tRNA:m(4)X modification enzyme TRM13 n=1 Tax=Plutella xylostella TaxID=51655 RepID=A0A8S4FJB6_PLUXY|nr:unnamed protein product [Plutella xylostella]